MIDTSTRRDAWQVVVVDDNEDDRAEVRQLLLRGSERRYRFVALATITGAAKAIRELPFGRPDCAILDYNLLDGTALDLLAELTESDGSVVCPVVVITNGGAPELARQVLRAGAQDFISKSWLTAESLTRTVENAVERWAMKNELRASEERLARAQRAARVGTWEWNVLTSEVSSTDEAARLYGRAPAAAPTSFELWLRCIHPEDREAVAARAHAALAGGVYHDEYRVLHPDGRVLWLESLGERVVDRAGVAVQMIGTVSDVTQRRNTQEALGAALARAEQAVHERDRLVALVSQDLCNPVNAMLMGVSALERHIHDRRGEITSEMALAAQRMSELLDELLASPSVVACTRDD